MYELSLSTVPSWQNWNNMWVPVCVDTSCPHCGRIVTLPLETLMHDPNRNSVSASSRCPGCRKKCHLWLVEPGDGRDTSKRGSGHLAIYPQPRALRQPIVAADRINPALARAYQSCLEAYNAGLWAACATSCRRTLEGLVKILLGQEHSRDSLVEQLRALPEKVNLAEPLMTLADNLRKGGNIGAHFDLEKEPNQPVAQAMVDLIDYILEYVYVLKDKASDLEERIDALGKQQESKQV